MDVLRTLVFAFALLCLLAVPGGNSQSFADPLTWIPLAARTPYLNYWSALAPGASSPPPASGQSSYPPPDGAIWRGIAIVDGVSYTWLGDPVTASSSATSAITKVEVTPTRTVATMDAGAMELTVTFLSPIEPGDWVRQSIPFAYVSVEAQSLDGAPHSVQLYSAIGADWSSRDPATTFVWTRTIGPTSVSLSTTLHTPSYFVEDNDGLPQWGTVFYATSADEQATYKIGNCTEAEALFENSKSLDNSVYNTTTTVASVGENTCFAMAHDLGNITVTPRSIFWALGNYRDAAVQYNDLNRQTQTRSLYLSANSSLLANSMAGLVDFVVSDFPSALIRATQLDNSIMNTAFKVSPAYADLISIATRQAYAATELTIAKGSDGSWNQSDVMMFMKNTGGDNSNRVNAVRTLYPSFPIFMFIDATLGAPLLEPLLRFQSSSNYSNGYAALDAGPSYPTATPSNEPHQYGVEETGSMLVMAYAHLRASNDSSLVERYYPLLKTWSDYLVANTLFTQNQLSADGDTASNQTNLALKGIVAIAAMSRISSALNEPSDSAYYSSTASSFASQWTRLALGPDKHMLAVYGDQSSWTLGYNLFLDRWLGTNLLDPSIYEAHTTFLGGLLASDTNSSFEFGIPTNNLKPALTSQTAWNLFSAAMVTTSDVRDRIIKGVHAAMVDVMSTPGQVFPLLYNSSNGHPVSGARSPAQGAMYALLVYNQPTTGNSSSSSSSSGKSGGSHSKAGPIAGGVVGGLALLLAVLGIFLRRRRAQRELQGAFTAGALPVSPFHTQDDATYRPARGLLARWSVAQGRGRTAVPPETEPESPEPEPYQEIPSDKLLARLRTMNAEADEAQHVNDINIPMFAVARPPSTVQLTPPPSPPPALAPAPAVQPVSEAPSSSSGALDAERLREEIMVNVRREINQTLAEHWVSPPEYVDDRPREPRAPY
ncbi:hypothetical protein FA95DRAFT_1566133 [Auriscalpium vulgare]|uniref:Uncharacterized protein n=1 Tax=Auriscalpium vulgare TaxID=40419 RepID=A0ACB8RA02_9AGAM|nr:hypothetical protein FA95DRAFT_1566133 [Auriscalpium vulgare]